MGQYATVSQLRDQGAPSTLSDERLLEALELASRFIDAQTGFFFERRDDQVYRLDGRGTPILELPVAALELEYVKVDGHELDLTGLVNYNDPPPADDMWYPHLELVQSFDSLRLSRATIGSRRGGPVFSRGPKNVEVKGDFGFVLSAPAASGSNAAPIEIRRATLLLAAALMEDIATSAAAADAGIQSFQSETLGNYSYTLSSAAAEVILSGYLVNNPQVGQLISAYTRIRMGSA